jgi:hypothetical protein
MLWVSEGVTVANRIIAGTIFKGGALPMNFAHAAEQLTVPRPLSSRAAHGEGPHTCKLRDQEQTRINDVHVQSSANAEERLWGPSPSARLGMTSVCAPNVIP